MSHSTKAILRSLFKSPLTRGQLQSSFAKHNEDSESGDSVNRPTTTSVVDDGRIDDALQLKIQPPKLTPMSEKKLTSDEKEKLLEIAFVSAKHRFNSFKEMLRQKGVDVTNYFISIHNGRISYTINGRTSYEIPKKESYSRLFMPHYNKMIKLTDIQENELSKHRSMKI